MLTCTGIVRGPAALLKVWEFNTAVKRVEFNEDGSQLLAVTEKRMGFLGRMRRLSGTKYTV